MKYVGNIIYDEKLMDTQTKFVIFGAGKAGKAIYEFFDINERTNSILCFCDRNCMLWNTEYKGIKIVNPEKIMQEHSECHFLAGGLYGEEIAEYLISNGIENIHILFLN